MGSVCHGPMGIMEATGPDGKSIVSGKQCTGFSNTEEEAVGKTEKVPFLLEDRLRALGGKYEKKGDWSDFSLRDGCLITGEHSNPIFIGILCVTMLSYTLLASGLSLYVQLSGTFGVWLSLSAMQLRPRAIS